jgi:hypothetical protein
MEISKIRKILDELCQTIGGDWLLVGGALVQIEFNEQRATEDIDLALIASSGKSEAVLQTELFRFSMNALQIGPESVNLAVTPFLNDIPGWRDECKLLQAGAAGNIYRPTLTLFIALKMKRASSIDLSDIREALKHWPSNELNEMKLQSWLTPDRFQKYLGIKKQSKI